jgi:thymidylate kinase
VLLDHIYGCVNGGSGKFILIEGINGSGKTTKAEMLTNDLAKTRSVTLTREPTQNSFGRLIRRIIDGGFVSGSVIWGAEKDLEPFWRTRRSFCLHTQAILETLKCRRNLSEVERQKLFVTDRFLHLLQIQDALSSGWLVQYRYDISSYCHGMAKGLSFERNLAYHQMALGNLYLAPDIIFYFWVPIELAIQRLQQSGKVIDIYETEETLRKVEMAARQILGFVNEQPIPGAFLEREFVVLGEHHPIFVINAELPKEEVYKTVRRLID